MASHTEEIVIKPRALALIIFSLWSVLIPNGAAASGNPSQAGQTIVRYEARWDVQQSGVDDTLYDVFFMNPLAGWAVGDNNTIIRTTDGGVTWGRATERREGGPQFTEVTFVNENEGWVAGGATLLYTRNGGETWQPAAQPAQGFGRYGPAAVVGSTRFQLSVPTLGNRLYRTDDGGRSWTATQATLPHNDYEDVSFVDPMRGWMVRGGFSVFTDKVVMTEDGGNTWRTVEQQVYYAPRIQFVNPTTGWVFGENGSAILLSVDGGWTWERQFTGLQSSNALTDMHFLNEVVGYVLSNVGGGIVIRTTDGGWSWHQIGRLGAPSNVRAISFPDPEHGWVVGDRGFIIHYHLVPVYEEAMPGEPAPE